MNGFKWMKAIEIAEGDLVSFRILKMDALVKVSKIDAFVGKDEVTVFADTGHQHTLKIWKDVQVMREAKEGLSHG